MISTGNVKHCRLFQSLLCLALLGTVGARADEAPYQLGRGYAVSDRLTIGGYFSSEYSSGDNQRQVVLDDLAVLFYGAFENRFSYLLELESIDVVRYDFRAHTRDTRPTPTIERLYGDYKFSDHLSLRVGKQITPIGYWNLQPINVLRETTSNPEFSYETFPKFLTGVDFYGYAPFDEALSWHLYLQGTRDMDEDNINIPPERHVGVALEKQFGGDWQAGASLGRFRTLADRDARYIVANARRDGSRVTVMTEGIAERIDLPVTGSVTVHSGYLQGEYHVNSRHAIVGRVEYYHDPSVGPRERIGILGYSYRPLYPVSLKLEYQWHAAPFGNEIMASFSVLF